MHYIYLVRNAETHEPYYVGQTANFEERSYTHLCNESFINPESIILQQTIDEKVADFWEAYYTIYYETYKERTDRTYNVAIGTFPRHLFISDDVKQVNTKHSNFNRNNFNTQLVKRLKETNKELRKEIKYLKQQLEINDLIKENKKLKEVNYALRQQLIYI